MKIQSNTLIKPKCTLNDLVYNPFYLVWSNDFDDLNKYFNTDDHLFVKNEEDKIITDFYLLTQCKYFIGPSTFNWWGAWLSSHKDKICVRPKNINPSNNSDFWPKIGLRFKHDYLKMIDRLIKFPILKRLIPSLYKRYIFLERSITKKLL